MFFPTWILLPARDKTMALSAHSIRVATAAAVTVVAIIGLAYIYARNRRARGGATREGMDGPPCGSISNDAPGACFDRGACPPGQMCLRPATAGGFCQCGPIP
jgi:hypothetical protein